MRQRCRRKTRERCQFQTAAAANAATVQSQVIPEAQTFTGTLPCFHSEMRCTAAHHANPCAQWTRRARPTLSVRVPICAQLEQGCWRAALMAQPRVVILTPQGNVVGMTLRSSTQAMRYSLDRSTASPQPDQHSRPLFDLTRSMN